MRYIEIVDKYPQKRIKPKVVLFDFDGTLSTLRYGWGNIMEQLMLEMISGKTKVNESLVKKVRDYINQSTGIQTYYQMKWLAETVHEYGRNPSASSDPWWYKAEYNRRLMELVGKRITRIKSGESKPSDYLIMGSREFVEALYNEKVDIYLASGTDHPDVNHEAEVLGVRRYFKEVCGAPLGKVDCPKEAVLSRLLEKSKLCVDELVVIGDGKVEIALGRKWGGITLGIASDEEKLCGTNPSKRERLIKAGAHAIVGDFAHLDELMNWLGF